MSKHRTEGWAHPINERKAHYYVDGRSLCMRKGFFGEPEEPQALGDAPRADDCKACWRARAKVEGKAPAPSPRKTAYGGRLGYVIDLD